MGAREYILLFVVAMLFVVTFWTAGQTASLILEGIQLIGCVGCVDTSADLFFIFTTFYALVSLTFASGAWLVLRMSNVPRGFILPISTLTFASVVAYLTYSGEQSVNTYFNGYLWLLVPLLLAGYLYVYLVLHYRRE